MNASEPKPPAANNSGNSGGIFGALGNAFSKAKNAVVGNNKAKNGNTTNSKTNNSKKNNNKKNNSKPNNSMKANNSTPPAVAGVNAPVINAKPNSTAPAMSGGVAPVNFRYPPDMQQPSEKVMQWATTAGVPTPTGPEMRNVAHGGKRRTRRNKTRNGGSRRNRNRNRRNKSRNGGSRRNRTRRNKSRNGGSRRNRRNRNRTRRNRN